MLSTWSFGVQAIDAGWPTLDRGGEAIDAIEAACRAIEADPAVDSVGLGGLPDALGQVTLDAAIMLGPGRAAGVADIRHFVNPVSIARRVMERTTHRLLVGPDAERFAASEGFERVETLLTDDARAVWERWRDDPTILDDDRYRGWIPPRNVEELRGVDRGLHDTVCVMARDASGVIGAGCTTSGMAFKTPGRVGDAAIIGHALYVDPKVGAAIGTGTGELFMSTCASFFAVERLRAGDSPAQASIAVIERIAESIPPHPDHQAAAILMTPDGAWSAAALRPGFRAAFRTRSSAALVEPDFVLIPEEPKRGAHESHLL